MRASTALFAVATSAALHAAVMTAIARLAPPPAPARTAEASAHTVAERLVPFRPTSRETVSTSAVAPAVREEKIRNAGARVKSDAKARGPEPAATDTGALEASRALHGGGVTIERDANTNTKALPRVSVLPPAPKLVPREEQQSGDDRVDEIRPAGGGSYVVEHGAARARIGHDGTLTIERPGALDKTLSAAHGLLFLDPLPLFYLASGANPAATDEVAILERTRALRTELCARASEETLRASLLEVLPELQRILRMNAPLADRRERIFRFWDGCMEEGSPAITHTAELARELVVEFIRDELPAGSAEGYSEDELRALNARRRSKQRFEPYALAER